MDPYRTLPVEPVADVEGDPGIVGDVIAQFADPLAFLRELVQNAIDAGSPTVEVRIEYELETQLARVSVRDRGEGMSRDVIENQLLVLFRSTKETDGSKIGKFGIGFASVLAPNPEVVIVDTVRDGKRLTLHLQRDLAYQLFDTGNATQAGTTVTLELHTGPGAFDALAAASERTLVRWCRHALVPIELAVDRGDGAATPAVRIDRPLAIEGALVEVQRELGELTVVVGITGDPEPYTGFFNHGLTLYETRAPVLGRVAVKLQSASLGHTLSRDDVRRDGHYHDAVAAAADVVAHELTEAVIRALAAAADAADPTRHRELAHAIVAAGLELPATGWRFPLVHPLADGARSIAASALGSRVYAATRDSALTAALAASAVPVLRLEPREREWTATLAHATIVGAEAELTCVTPIDATDAQVALVAMLGELLAATGRAPSAIVLAELDGAHADALAIAGKATASTQPYVVDRDQAQRSPFGRLRRAPLVLGASHELVRAAAAGDVRTAASHLARVVLLQYRKLDVERSRGLLDATLDRLGIGEA